MYDTGSTTFMLICTMLVFLMTPGLAFFYGGLSRRKNVINTMLMCFGALDWQLHPNTSHIHPYMYG